MVSIGRTVETNATAPLRGLRTGIRLVSFSPSYTNNMPPRTPREAKQEFLNDLITTYRETNFRYLPEDTLEIVATKARQYNITTITKLAVKHGLVIPPKKDGNA